MTNLSWVIYLGDVLPSFVGLIGISGFIICFCCALFIVLHAANRSFEDEPINWLYVKRACQYFLATIGILLITSLIPSKTTIYMIAAAETGDTILNTPDGQKVMQTLKEIVIKKIDEAAK